MRHLLLILCLAISACAPQHNDVEIGSLYIGYEGGTWYKYSPESCSATLCAAC